MPRFPPKSLPPGYQLTVNGQGYWQVLRVVRPGEYETVGHSYTRRVSAVNWAWQDYGRRQAEQEKETRG